MDFTANIFLTSMLFTLTSVQDEHQNLISQIICKNANQTLDGVIYRIFMDGLTDV